MPSFPKSEAEVLVLAGDLKAGLAAHEEVFPEPPIPATTLTTALTALQAAMDKVTAARAASESATLAKVEALEVLVEAMKKDLRYAEQVTDDSDEKLKLIGWGAKKPSVPVALPGQPRQLKLSPQTDGRLMLEWLVPAEGGKPTVYQVQRRLRSGGVPEVVASVLGRDVTLQNQPRGEELEYSVIATNKTGDGPVSNVVVIVL
jgi:hypothetical protein